MNELNETPKANRLHIGFFGRCNAGKSTLINMLTGQSISIVSEVAGTTTDSVSKTMEILPLGPVVITDTAGIDDSSNLGQLRMAKTKEILSKMNLAVYVLRSEDAPTQEDIAWLTELQKYKISTLIVINEVHRQLGSSYIADNEVLKQFGFPSITGNMQAIENRSKVLTMLSKLKPIDEEKQSLLAGVVAKNDVVVLVCPIDKAAPKGRLILPQVQMIREILDSQAMSFVCQTGELSALLAVLKEWPKLVITDSQAFEEVAQILPSSVPLTSFSILMARFKGKLKDLVQGARAIKGLKAGSKVLISEGCTHHRQCDDIGTVKIPNWLAKAGYKDLDLQWSSGGAFPENVKEFDLIIHCGACMLTRREVLRRIEVAVVDGVPIVNYGVLIAALHGILERTLSPFSKELE